MKVLITVKTYPSISAKYEELVCTAGFTENGDWIRIYPVPLRRMSYESQYKKYDWVEVDLVKNTRDFRPESYRPKLAETEFVNVGHIDTTQNWAARKEIVLGKVYHSMSELISDSKNRDKYTSLATYRPYEIIDFKIESVAREWDKNKLEALKQMNMFEIEGTKKIEVVRKLPFKFSYVIDDGEGKKRTMMIEDWEIGQLFWKQLTKYGDEKKACDDVRNKYFDDLAKTKDLYLFLGTTQANHIKGPNPFVIIGCFYPKKESQLSLDL